MKPTTIVRRASLGLCLAACLSLSACMTHTAIAIDNIGELYVPMTEDDDENMVLITATTVSLPGVADFTIEIPIVYDTEGTDEHSRKIESKLYKRDGGTELEFRRTYMAGTKQWIESVILRHGGTTQSFYRLRGYRADTLRNGWGLHF